MNEPQPEISTRRRDNIERSINICVFLMVYIFLNFLFYKHIIIINSTIGVIFICFGCGVYCYIRKVSDDVNDETNSSNEYDSSDDSSSSSELDTPTSADSIEVNIPAVDVPTITATPIEPHEFYSPDALVVGLEQL